jgi:hypothetical protein
VRLPEHDHVVETFPSDRADQFLRVRILPRRARGNGLVADANGSLSARDRRTGDASREEHPSRDAENEDTKLYLFCGLGHCED